MNKGPYRTPADIIRSATDIVDMLATIRVEIARHVGNFYVESYGKDVCELIGEITNQVEQTHIDLLDEHIEARFRRIEEKLDA